MLASSLERGRREGRVQAAPMARHKKAGGSHHRFGRTTGLPCATVLTVSFVLPGDRAFLPRRSRASQARELSISVGMPGPHDFAVRVRISRPRKDCAPTCRVHRIPHPTFVTIAKRPSWQSAGRAENASDLGPTSRRLRKIRMAQLRQIGTTGNMGTVRIREACGHVYPR
jgi:hypothetical protein